jgi:hypothetical protein
MKTIPLQIPLLGGLAVLLASPLPAQGQSFTLTGNELRVHNLVGEIVVERAAGSVMEVEVLLHGRDAEQLRVERGRSGGRETVEVIYPSTEIVYPRGGRSGSTQLSVQGDDWPAAMRGRSYTITNSGPGLEAHAVVRVRLPAGGDAQLRQGVGSMRIAGVQGTVEVNAHAASVGVTDFSGRLRVRAGSGSIEMDRVRGSAQVRTGSGRVQLSGAQAELLELGTGSGGVTLRGATVGELTLSAGSGRLELEDVRARTLSARTGSGAIRARLSAAPADLQLHTGSGGVTLDLPRGTGAELQINTGSGGIAVDLPTTKLSSGRSHLRATTGDGSGRIRISTGSGGVRVGQS